MNLVDVVDLEAAVGGGVVSRFAQFANFVDSTVGGAIDLEDVEGASLRDLDADVLVGIEVDPGTVRAVKGLGEDAGGGGLARAAGADEEVGMGEALAGDGIAQGGHHMILAEDVLEGPGAVFAGEDLVAHAGSKVGRSKVKGRRLGTPRGECKGDWGFVSAAV